MWSETRLELHKVSKRMLAARPLLKCYAKFAQLKSVLAKLLSQNRRSKHIPDINNHVNKVHKTYNPHIGNHVDAIRNVGVDDCCCCCC